MDETLAGAWRTGRLPLVNAVTWADGRMVLLARRPTPGPGTVVTALAGTTLASFLGFNPEWWVEVDEWARCTGPAETVIVGDGSYGADGFVALLDTTGQLVFSVFLDFSEPFGGVRLTDTEIVATTDRATWTFDVREPWRVRVELDQGA